MSKRPKGLAKSQEKKRGAEPASKKQKLETEEESLLSDDWEDLQELFARANGTFVKGDRSGALPLLRGVLHECDRLKRNTSLDDLLALSSLPSPLPTPTDSHASFFSLYADALIHMGLVMGRHPELAVPPEPASADTYFETAIDMLVEQYPTNNEDPSKAKKLSENVRLQFTWADAYFLRADVAASELIEADDMSEASKNISELMQQGYEHALHAQASAPAYFALPPAAQDEAESTPAQSSSTASPSGEEDKQIPERLPQLTVNRLNGYFGARVWDILEQLDDEAAGLEGDDMQETWRERSGTWLKNAGLQASLPGEEDAQYASVVGKAKEKLAEVATLLASEEEDGDESEAVDAGKEEENTGKARPMLDKVLKDLDAALEIAKGCTGRSDLIISVDELETTELAQEALLYRINISLDDADREQWIQYAKDRQIDIDDEDEEDDEGEEEEEMEE